MAKHQVYFCTRHNGEVPRELLLAKKVVFVEMGEGGRVQRSRVTEWLCPKCISEDPDWNRPKSKAPGTLPNRELSRERS